MKQGKGKDKIVYIVLVLGMMGLIFAFSAQPSEDSYQLSSYFVAIYAKIVENLPFLPHSIQATLITKAGYYVRKLAHFIIYAGLGAITLVALGQTKLKKNAGLSVTLGICMLYAITDEWHQYYVAGRSARFVDVLIDTFGALIGCLLVKWIKNSILKFDCYNKKKKYEKSKL